MKYNIYETYYKLYLKDYIPIEAPIPRLFNKDINYFQLRFNQ